MRLKKYYKETPIRLRKIGDAILIGSTSLAAVMMTAPINETNKVWTVFILNIVGVVGKIITNFFKGNESENEEIPNS